VWISNWLSLLGALVFASSLLTAVFFFLAEPRAHGNVYSIILLFGVMPVAVFLGLALYVLGNLLERRRRQRQGDAYVPQLTLGSTRGRWTTAAVALLGLLYFLCSLYGSYRSYHFMESTSFCGQLCHEIMGPEYTAHSLSPHAGVRCTDCHVGPRPERFVAAKLAGLRQARLTLLGTFSRPIPTPVHDLPPPREACHQCHWPEDFVGSKLREFVYFLPDEANSKYYTSMLVHVGGNPPAVGGESGEQAGAGPGIHWHMRPDTKIEFIATDERRQEIPWVRVTDGQGKVTVYRTEDETRSDEVLLATYPIRVMDCIDCHNRAAHRFATPNRILNTAMIRGKVSPEIPWIKREGVKVLTAEYATRAEADEKIASGLRSYYQTQQAEFWEQKRDLVETGIAALLASYQKNVFPEMKAGWKANPDNIGHMVTPGCFRCHDGNHLAGEDRPIRKDCALCHDFVRQGKGPEIPPLQGPQEFSHYGKVGKLWKQTRCTNCHE